jgi:predicted amidohydrolase YtcJ
MRTVGLFVAAIMVVVAVAGCFGGGSEPAGADEADWVGFLLVNATVWTADSARPWAEAVAVADDRIVAVGSEEEVRGVDLGGPVRVVDLGGRLLVPGFHDTHNHFVEVARATDPASGTNPYEPWPAGWDPVAGTIQQQQTAAGHVGTWAEHNAQRVQEGTPPAPPARLHGLEAHEDGHGVEGRLAANDLWFGGPAVENAPEDWKRVLRMGLATAASFGITSHVEAGTSLDAFHLLEEMRSDGELTARFNLYVFPEDLEALTDQGVTTGTGSDRVRVLGLKLYSDGWLGPRTAALREPYEDRPHQGFTFFTQDEVDGFVLEAHQAGLKVTAHAIGDRATDMMLKAYERALGAGCPEESQNLTVCRDPRFSLEHAQLVQPDLMERMVGIGLVPSIQMSFATSDAPWAEDAIGAQRLEYAYPWRTMVEEGLVVGGSSDFPIEVLPPLWGLERMVTRVDLNGEPAGGFMPEQAVDVETALRMVTIDAAYLEYREHEVGTLTSGKYADLVVLERNLFEIPADEIADTRVALTMVGGQVVHAEGPLGDAFPDSATF